MNIKICTIFITMILLTACASDKRNDIAVDSEPAISVLHGEFSIDVDNYRELSGDADYVVLGQVTKELYTEYRYPVEKESEDGSIEILTVPHTHYEIRVLENLKGDLSMEEPIIIVKDGGLREDNSEYALYEDDVLPEQGNKYIFYIYAQEDGSNFVGGPNSTIPIDITRTPKVATFSSEIVEESKKVFEEIEAGVTKETVIERERFVSSDDILRK